MGDQDLGFLQIHLEDPDISDDNMSQPSTDRVLSSAEARATIYGRTKGVSVKVSDTVLG